MDFYFDAEFDAIRRYEGCVQCLVSIGVVAAQDGKVVDTYYSLIQPKRFRKLTRVVKEMTQLQNEAIRQAPSFLCIMQEVAAFMDAWATKKERHLYSFGPDDTRTIHSHAAYEKCGEITLFDATIDLQKMISPSVVWQSQMISSTLSLDDLKYAYGIEGEVVHNALNDALDLMRIHHAYLHAQPIVANVKEIYERKEKKRLLVKQRSKERMERILNERYGHYDQQMIKLPCYPSIVEQLMFLSEQKLTDGLHFFAEELKWRQDCWRYEEVELYLIWQFVKQPSMRILLKTQATIQEIEVVLTYRNAGIFDDICKIVLKKVT